MNTKIFKVLGRNEFYPGLLDSASNFATGFGLYVYWAVFSAAITAVLLLFCIGLLWLAKFMIYSMDRRLRGI